MLITENPDNHAVVSSFRAWSKRTNSWVEVSASKGGEGVDELLRTGVGTRMLVPDWDQPQDDESTPPE